MSCNQDLHVRVPSIDVSGQHERRVRDCWPRNQPVRRSNTAEVIPLLRSSHFQPTMAVTGFATALALSAGRGTGAILVAAAVLCGQLSVGWSNDYIDRARDRTAARMDKPIVAGSVSARLVWR